MFSWRSGRRVVGGSKVVVVVRRIARALLAEFTHTLPLFPDTCKQALPRRVRVGCRHVKLAELSKAHSGVTPFPGLRVAIEASISMLLLDVFDRPRARDTFASQGSRADTHYHIVTTFEAKESGCAGAKSWRFRAVGVRQRRPMIQVVSVHP